MNNNTQNGILTNGKEPKINIQIEWQLFKSGYLLSNWNFNDLIKTLENQEDEFKH